MKFDIHVVKAERPTQVRLTNRQDHSERLI